jgi:hypothetical protein
MDTHLDSIKDGHLLIYTFEIGMLFGSLRQEEPASYLGLTDSFLVGMVPAAFLTVRHSAGFAAANPHSLPLFHFDHDRLDIDYRGTVHCFQGPDSNAVWCRYLDDFHTVEADGVWSVGGARRKHSSHRPVWITTGMDPKQVANGFMKPGKN